jgi:hypothetical protein
MPAAHEVKFEEKSGGDAVCAAALATVNAAAMPPARSCAVEANLDIILSLVKYAHRGTDLVVLLQPDGSFASIPAWMSTTRLHGIVGFSPAFSRPSCVLYVLRRASSLSPIRLGIDEPRRAKLFVRHHDHRPFEAKAGGVF